MSGLRERLGRLRSAAGSKPESFNRQERPESVDREQEAWASIDCRVQSTEFGTFIVRTRTYSFNHIHGHYRLGELPESLPELAAFASGGSSFAPGKWMFLDTETTGLGIGAGNLPFLIGVGSCVSDGFLVEQFFIRNPAEERAMLLALQRRMDQFDYVVSYNGRAFDWPVLRNRYVMNRLTLDDAGLRHIDLLYPSRSIWKNTLPSCKLGRVEEARLGIVRDDDLPGAEAPARYFAYLTERRPEWMREVFLHNERDILTLVSLAVHFARILAGRLDFRGMEPEELFRTGIWLDKIGRTRQSLTVMRQLAELSHPERRHFDVPLAAFYKKRGLWDEAVRLWERCASQDGPLRLTAGEALIELSKFYEHRRKNAAAALRYAEAALERAQYRAGLLRARERHETLEPLKKRVERLRKKAARASAEGIRPFEAGKEKKRLDKRSGQPGEQLQLWE
jgi:hypothetical protein